MMITSLISVLVFIPFEMSDNLNSFKMDLQVRKRARPIDLETLKYDFSILIVSIIYSEFTVRMSDGKRKRSVLIIQ
jgi:hypothetical protein